MTTDVNICTRIFAHCQDNPEHLALRIPNMQGLNYLGEENLTYGELGERCAQMQSALAKLSLQTGDRVLILARPKINTYILMLALFSLGLVPVLIDRGMSRDRIFASIKASKAKVAIGEAAIMRLWWMFPPLWRFKRFAYDGHSLGVKDLRKLYAAIIPELQCELLPANAHGLITFTSGSTGTPKGADRTHQSLIEQHLAIRAHGQDTPDDVDSPCFPVVVLHNLCCGISTVMPCLDLAAPAKTNAEMVIKHWQKNKVTRLSSAPAFIQAICEYALANRLQLTNIRSVVVGGSTIPHALTLKLDSVFPNAEILLVYGSTEAEPIAHTTLSALRQDWNTYAGHLVGKPVAEAEVCLSNPDVTLNNEHDVQQAVVKVENVGEILVSGKHVLQAYVDNPAANQETKIPRANGLVWHRTGDAGFFDTQGRLWLVGRIKDALMIDGERIYTFAAEKELDALANINRSALIQYKQTVILALETTTSINQQTVLNILIKHHIPRAQFVLIDHMPVDGRHNSKIDRVQLKKLLSKGKLRPQP
ncbi:MAG TPA: fatty acid CoA ligase family protein, partial [Agitococcus sp.]|nr:fatty acid CoA ligase family protein [Agitococcus sp.]